MFNSISKALLVPERFYSLFDVLAIAVIIMALLLKFVAARRAWINGQTVWFWLLIFINTLGIFEAIYLLTNKEVGGRAPRVKKAKKIKEVKETEVNLETPKEVSPEPEAPKTEEVAPIVEETKESNQ